MSRDLNMTRNGISWIVAAIVSVSLFGSSVFPKPGSDGPPSAAASRDSDSLARPLNVGHPTFASPHASPIAVNEELVFVVNTPADTVDVIDAATTKIKTRIQVGVDPVSIGVRPDGREIWVSNHVSDSVNVIDADPASPTYLQVVATIQEFDPRTKATTFDEPMGIAFASNKKAYVALSSENQIAVIDVASRKITSRLVIPAQDPRSIAVHGSRLYVIPFESNNRTQLSGGSRDDMERDRNLYTFDAWEHSIRVNNVLSIGHVTDIVKHPDVPDRDLFVFDTETDRLIETVDTLGTLLYGITVDSDGQVYIAQTDARNDSNGRAGTRKHGMKEMENRAFLNQITKVSFRDGKADRTEFINLEPLPPEHPKKGEALATPYAIQVSGDDSTLVASAAGSDKLFTVDTESGKVLGRISVGAVPRGIALENSESGRPARAWVYNAIANTVSVVNLSDAAKPRIAGFVKLHDPTHRQMKLGRTWFNDADASTTGTFSCESCHPDNNVDQLLWVLNTPIVTGGNQIMPRSTMPIRGLRDTAPFHWDGVLGDPYGGNNSAHIRSSVAPTAEKDDQTTATRHLIDVSLADILLSHGDETINDEGKPGHFTAAERDDLAVYLLSVPFPPAQRRAYDNVLTKTARQGFRLFHIEGDLDPGRTTPNVCGNCHRMPFWVSTNTPGTGMEAPTWRGAYDRFLILPQGRLNIIEFPFYRRVAERGNTEQEIWRFSWGGRSRFDPVWNMVVEGSTGFSGTFARQVTLSRTTVNDELTLDLLNALELAAAERAVVLEAEGVLIDDSESSPVELQFHPTFQQGAYVGKDHARNVYSRRELIELAASGRFVGTFTGRHGKNADYESPQPALWTLGPIERQRGRQRFPIIHEGKPGLSLSGRHFDESAGVYVDGRRVEGSITFGLDRQEEVIINLASLPEVGMHLLQVQTQNGLFSNDFIFHVVKDADAAVALKKEMDDFHIDRQAALTRAIARGNLEYIRRHLDRGARVNRQSGGDGSLPLSDAALRGRLDIVKLLLERGARVNGTNRDGNTPLHVAAFMCRKDVVEFLLKKGASPLTKNNRGETVIDVVAGEWSNGLGALYTGIGKSIDQKIDLERMREERLQMQAFLEEKVNLRKDK